MKNKDYRELQLSSSQLFFIFLAILILGVVIFLLGVSVGKKQAQIQRGTPITAQQKVGQAEIPTAPPSEESKEPASKALTSPQKPTEETQEQPAVSDDSTLYYVQVGAFNRRDMAVALADAFNQRGYPAFVLDPSPSDRTKWYKVRIGGYATREEAVEVRDKLRSESSRTTDYFIIRS